MPETRKDVPMKVRRLRGFGGLELLRVDLGPTMDGSPHLGWRVTIAGEPWVLQQPTPMGWWHGATENAQVEAPKSKGLEEMVRWIIQNQRAWQARLKANRSAENKDSYHG